MVVGSEANWKYNLEHGNMWGLKEFREMVSLWNLLEEGDKLLMYVSSPVCGIVGIGTVTTKLRQTNPQWPEELRKNAVVWPLRFEFDVEYCLPPSSWPTRSYSTQDVKLITRMVFQCIPDRVASAVRQHFGLKPEPALTRDSSSLAAVPASVAADLDHESIKNKLSEIGRIQGFLTEMEYPIESSRLDVVWRRVTGSVPNYVFEVQVGGDIYHALAKLKHAYDLWNSHIFVAADPSARTKYDELLAGTFHEISNRARFLQLADVAELHKRKRSYRDFEREMGIIQT